MAAGNQRRTGILFASKKTRVQGVTGNQTVKATPALLHRLLISNSDAAVQTVTLLDGGTTLNVIRCPAGQSFQPELYIQMGTSLVINPSNANLDVLAVFD
jgi:hypothetical protein